MHSCAVPPQANGGLQAGWGLGNSFAKLLGGGSEVGEGGDPGFSPHAVASIRSGGAAVGVLEKGDEITAVNGTSIVEMHPQKVQEMFGR